MLPSGPAFPTPQSCDWDQVKAQRESPLLPRFQRVRGFSEQRALMPRMAEWLTGAQEGGVGRAHRNSWCECPRAFRTQANLSLLSPACSRLGEVCSADQSTDKQQGCPAAAGSQRAERRERPQALPSGRGKGKGSFNLALPSLRGSPGWKMVHREGAGLEGTFRTPDSWLSCTPLCVTLGKWANPCQLCTFPYVKGNCKLHLKLLEIKDVGWLSGRR